MVIMIFRAPGDGARPDAALSVPYNQLIAAEGRSRKKESEGRAALGRPER
jgi:hypothetical protein